MRALVLATLAVGVVVSADDPPKKELTAEERTELEAKWRAGKGAADRAYQAGKLDEMEAALRECLAVARRLYPGQDHPAVAASLNNLAFALGARGRYADAEPLHRDALAMRRRLYPGQDHPAVAESLNNLAGVLRGRERYADAEPLLRDALAMYRRLFPGDHPAVARSLHNLAFVLDAQGRYADVEPLYRDALAMGRRLHDGRDHPDVAAALNNLAGVLRARGRYADAEPLYRDALAMWKRLHPGDHPAVAEYACNLGSLLDARGKYAEAEPFLRDALAMYRRLFPGDHPTVAAALNNLAGVLDSRGKLADAEPLYRDALAMEERLHPGRDHPDVAAALSNLGYVLHARGQYAEAEPLLRDALDMRRRLYPKQDHPDVARSLHNLAGVLQARERYADAELSFRDALAMRSRLYPKQDHPDVAAGLSSLAGVLHVRGKYAEAEPLFRDALAMKRRLYGGDHPEVALGLHNLAGVLRDRGRYADAEPLHRDALRLYARLAAAHAAAGAEGDALTLAASRPRARDAFLTNARLNRTDPAVVYAEVWATKASVARVAERRALAARAATEPAAAALLAELRDTRRRRVELLMAPRPADPKTREERDAELEALARRVADLNAALDRLVPAAGRLDRLGRATPDDLRAALPADTAAVDLLAYSLFEQDPDVPGEKGRAYTPGYAAFVVTRGGVRWIDLGPAAPIDAAVRLWREAVTTPPFRVPPDIPGKVRELVWAAVRKELPAGTRVVYVSPDAALTGVPWAALPGDKPGTVLLEDHAIAAVPHLPFLLDMLWPTEERKNLPAGLLAVGGVAYGAEPERLGLWAAVASAGRTRGELAADPAKTLNWPDLPGARAEAEQVARRAAGRKLEARLLTGPRASADRVLAELADARYAHLATHGFFADKQFRSVLQLDPELFRTARGGLERGGHGAVNNLVMSGLVFAGANRPETPGRGIATGEALLDRDLSGLELAVLSACETGLGEVAGGEGVFGLQRAFHVAGTRNVVASLWKVPDAATAALMGEFYKALWDDNLPPVLALQKAQLAVYRADPKTFAELALRGPGMGDTDFDKAKAVIAKAPLSPDGKGRNPPVVWAAWSLSGPGR